jgi:hypothetical protein
LQPSDPSELDTPATGEAVDEAVAGAVDAAQGPPADPFTCPERVIPPPPSGEMYEVIAADESNQAEALDRVRILPPPGEPAEPASASSERQFSVTGLFVLMLGAAVGLGILRAVTQNITPGELALSSGVLALLGIVVFAFFRPWFIVRAAWWSLVAVYVVSSAVAMVRG